MDDEEEFPTQQLEEQIGKYLRETLAWMSVLADQRSLVVENSWFIRHAILVNEVTQDLLNLNIEVSLWEMEEVRSASAIAERLASYVASRMASSLPNDWHNSTVQTLRTNGEANDAAAGVLKAAMQQASEQTETGYLHRVLSKVLRLLLRYSDASQADAERWLAFAQTLEKKSELRTFKGPKVRRLIMFNRHWSLPGIGRCHPRSPILFASLSALSERDRLHSLRCQAK